jgi:2-dehydro-3-deoxyphosphogluconate aldolase/(4S)-4-hydroxy-2-oxoglutarate aldolase
MKMNSQENVIQILKKARLIPVVVIEDITKTEGICSELLKGGLPVAEITFRTACAQEAIKLAVQKFPDILTGAGTVVKEEQCQKAVDCGAKFIVSPGFSEKVAKRCQILGVPYFPGCVTPTEIMLALDYGIEIVKFFPAQVYGGLKAIAALGAAFPSVKFIPTGGVDNSNLGEFLADKRVFACGGSWFFKETDIAASVRKAVNIAGGNING